MNCVHTHTHARAFPNHRPYLTTHWRAHTHTHTRIVSFFLHMRSQALAIQELQSEVSAGLEREKDLRTTESSLAERLA